MAVSRLAYVDETFRDPKGRQAGYYQLTALVVDRANQARCRQDTALVAPTGGFKASALARDGLTGAVEAMLDHVAGTACWNLIALTVGHTSNQEGARQRCLGERLMMLDDQKVLDVTLDSREAVAGPDPEVRNKKDLRTWRDLVRAGRVARNMTLRHMHDDAEPLLWVPDAVGWAYRQHHLRGNRSYWVRVEAVTTVKVLP